MSPISKFAVFLALAGVLAVLFAFVPGHRAMRVPYEKVEMRPVKSEPPAHRLEKLPGEENRLGEAKLKAPLGEKIISSQVKVPAIRRGNNYGWVQLPRGTKVDLVRASGDCLWIRWDGTTVKVPPITATTGAVVVR